MIALTALVYIVCAAAFGRVLWLLFRPRPKTGYVRPPFPPPPPPSPRAMHVGGRPEGERPGGARPRESLPSNPPPPPPGYRYENGVLLHVNRWPFGEGAEVEAQANPKDWQPATVVQRLQSSSIPYRVRFADGTFANLPERDVRPRESFTDRVRRFAELSVRHPEHGAVTERTDQLKAEEAARRGVML